MGPGVRLGHVHLPGLARATYPCCEGYAEFMSSWMEPWSEWEFEPLEFLDAGDDVVVVALQRGKPKSGGPTVVMQLAQVWTVRDGTLVRMRMYASKAEALEAVGLAE